MWRDGWMGGSEGGRDGEREGSINQWIDEQLDHISPEILTWSHCSFLWQQVCFMRWRHGVWDFFVLCRRAWNLGRREELMAAAMEFRGDSPPPSYDEAMHDRRPRGPPPVYSEDAETTETNPQNQGRLHPFGATNREEVDVIILRQPSLERTITSQPESIRSNLRVKKKFTSNCFCALCKCRPNSCDLDCVCYNCVGFVMYFVFCLPVVLCCFLCRSICPETFGDCSSRDWEWKDRYDERNSNFCRLCCWSMIGLCCCYSCEEVTEVCPCAEPCTQRFAIGPSLRKLVCYFGNRKACDCSVNVLDEESFGFICDPKDCGCYYRDENCWRINHAADLSCGFEENHKIYIHPCKIRYLILTRLATLFC